MRRFLRAVPLLLLGLTVPAGAQLKVVTSTSDLYDIARQIGGNRIKIKPHFYGINPKTWGNIVFAKNSKGLAGNVCAHGEYSRKCQKRVKVLLKFQQSFV